MCFICINFLAVFFVGQKNQANFFQFWTHFHGENNPEFKQLFPIMNSLQEQFQRSPLNFDIEKAAIGDMCVARFKKDFAWYRAIVIGLHPERQSVDV